MKFLIKTPAILAAFICIPFFSKAGPGGGGPDPDPPPPVSAPLDGGVSFLIAAGIGYATVKRSKKRKKESVTTEKI